jgi:hypothetical protein
MMTICPPGFTATPTLEQTPPVLSLASSVNLFGTVEFNDIDLQTPVTLSPDNTEVTPVDLLSDALDNRPSVLLEITPLQVSAKPLDPRLDRLTKAGTLLLTFGGGVGNGVFKNLTSREEAIENVKANFKNPIARIAEGWRYDQDSFRTNYVEHTALWFGYAAYLKSKGASNKEAFVVSQVANVLWEGVVEGSYVPPSGKDLLTDLISSAAAIFLYDKGPGKYVGEKILRVEQWGARHHIKLMPRFGYNPATRGSRIGTQLVMYIR